MQAIVARCDDEVRNLQDLLSDGDLLEAREVIFPLAYEDGVGVNVAGSTQGPVLDAAIGDRRRTRYLVRAVGPENAVVQGQKGVQVVERPAAVHTCLVCPEGAITITEM